MSFHGLIAHFFSALNNIAFSGCTSLFIHLPSKGHLGCFLVWIIMSKDVINTCVLVFVWTYVFKSFGQIWRSTVAELHCKGMFNSVRNCQTAFQSVCTIYIPTIKDWEFLLVHILVNIWWGQCSRFRPF